MYNINANKLTEILVVILFFANIINFYVIQTTIIVESISIILIYFGFCIQKKKINKRLYDPLLLTLYLVFVVVISILKSNGKIGDLGKETYRFFSIMLLYIPLLLIDIPFEKVFKCILTLCKIHLFYTIYELLYINILNPGYINGLLFGNAILDFFNNEAKSPYMLPQGEYIIPFIRPFGIFLQPQKSTFIFSIAIIVKYILDKNYNQKTNKKWYYLFLVGTILSGGKTALLCNLLLFTIIKIKSFNLKFTYKNVVLVYVIFITSIPILFLSLRFLSSDHDTALALNREVIAYSHLNYKDILLGLGFIGVEQFEHLGFSGESFIFRILSQIGIINFTLLAILSIIVFKNKNIKVSLLICNLVIFMLIHYAVINIYFYIYVISIILVYEKNKSYNYSN